MRFTRIRLIDAIRDCGAERIQRFREFLLDCGSRQSWDKQEWQLVTQDLIDVISCWVGKTLTQEAWNFVQWVDVKEEYSNETQRPAEERINVYRYEDQSSLTVDIEVTTIHAAKGETHTATMVLETYFNKVHDLKTMVPYLINSVNQRLLSANKAEHMKRVFVGMTRPRELLCLAINKEHLEPNQVSDLADNDWVICDLTYLNTSTKLS